MIHLFRVTIKQMDCFSQIIIKLVSYQLRTFPKPKQITISRSFPIEGTECCLFAKWNIFEKTKTDLQKWLYFCNVKCYFEIIFRWKCYQIKIRENYEKVRMRSFISNNSWKKSIRNLYQASSFLHYNLGCVTKLR